MEQLVTILSVEIQEVKKKPFGAILVIPKTLQKNLVTLWDINSLKHQVAAGLMMKLLKVLMIQVTQDASLKQFQVRHANHGINKHLMHIMMLWQNMTLMEVTISVGILEVLKSQYGATLLTLKLHLNYVNLFHLQLLKTLVTLHPQLKNFFQEEQQKEETMERMESMIQQNQKDVLIWKLLGLVQPG